MRRLKGEGWRAKFRSSHEGNEASLFKVPVVGHSFEDIFLLHDAEGSTVSQAPGFVGSLFVDVFFNF